MLGFILAAIAALTFLGGSGTGGLGGILQTVLNLFKPSTGA